MSNRFRELSVSRMVANEIIIALRASFATKRKWHIRYTRPTWGFPARMCAGIRSPSTSLQAVQRSFSPLIVVVCLFSFCCLHTIAVWPPKHFGRIVVCLTFEILYPSNVRMFGLFRFVTYKWLKPIKTQCNNFPLSNTTCIYNFLVSNRVYLYWR